MFPLLLSGILPSIVLLHRPGCSRYEHAQQAAKVTWSLFPAVTQSDEVIKNSSPEPHCCWSMMQGNSDKWRRIQLLEASSSKAINLACCLQNISSNLLRLQEHSYHPFYFSEQGGKKKSKDLHLGLSHCLALKLTLWSSADRTCNSCMHLIASFWKEKLQLLA